MSFLDGIRETLSAGFSWVGGLTRMWWQTLQVGPRPPFGFGDIMKQLHKQGVQNLPIASMMSLFIGMILAWQFGDALAGFGAKMAIGNAASLALVRELVPTLLAITVGATMAAGMAAELGSMKVTEQIDAIASLGADPLKKLVWPRVMASTIGLPMLVVWGNVMALFGGMFIASFIFDVPSDYFYSTYIDELTPLDYFSSLSKGLVFGFLVGLIGCFQGFSTHFGTEAVGFATMRTVVATSIAIVIADFYLTMIFLPLS